MLNIARLISLSAHPTSVMIFRLRLVKFRMICYHDAEQLGHVETFHYGRTPLRDMHAEPISYVIAQIKELDSCWQDTIRKCKNILADLVSIYHPRFRGGGSSFYQIYSIH